MDGKPVERLGAALAVEPLDEAGHLEARVRGEVCNLDGKAARAEYEHAPPLHGREPSGASGRRRAREELVEAPDGERGRHGGERERGHLAPEDRIDREHDQLRDEQRAE